MWYRISIFLNKCFLFLFLFVMLNTKCGRLKLYYYLLGKLKEIEYGLLTKKTICCHAEKYEAQWKEANHYLVNWLNKDRLTRKDFHETTFFVLSHCAYYPVPKQKK